MIACGRARGGKGSSVVLENQTAGGVTYLGFKTLDDHSDLVCGLDPAHHPDGVYLFLQLYHQGQPGVARARIAYRRDQRRGKDELLYQVVQRFRD